MIIGLLMVSHEDDILEQTLAANLPFLDCFYALDGTMPNRRSKQIILGTGKCSGYIQDRQLPRPPFPENTVCGYRKAIHDLAVRDLGPDHWFVVLHGDEVWTYHPQAVIDGHPGADGFIFHVPLYFLREPWDYDRPALAQLRWHLLPGWPEFRLFRGSADVEYLAEQTFSTSPEGIHNAVPVDCPIKHYLFRDPAQQRERAQRHLRTQFDPDNYRHILEHDQTVWDDAKIASAQASTPFYSILGCDK